MDTFTLNHLDSWLDRSEYREEYHADIMQEVVYFWNDQNLKEQFKLGCTPWPVTVRLANRYYADKA